MGEHSANVNTESAFIKAAALNVLMQYYALRRIKLLEHNFEEVN